MLCRYQGAWRLYIELVRPLYRKMRPQVDAALNRASSVLVCNILICVSTHDFGAASIHSYHIWLCTERHPHIESG